MEEVQKRPEAAVHPIPPHMQVAVFTVAPLVSVQSGAATHRQKSAPKALPAELHGAVEVDSVL